MTRAVGRAIATSLLGALAGAAWLALFYGLSPSLFIDFTVTPPSLLSGVYPAERDRASGLTFAWTGEQMTLRLPGLDRHVDWTVELRARGARANPSQNPEIALFVDGQYVRTHQSATDFEIIRISIPAQATRRGAAISMRASPTFVPGPADPRPLGVMIDSITLSPASVVLPPREAVLGTAIASAAGGAAIALLGITAGSAVGAALLVGAGCASLIARGFGPYTSFPQTAAVIACWIAGITLVSWTITGIVRRQGFRNTAKFAAAFSMSALLLELLVLFHPDMPIGDALFHAHRFRTVLGGNLHFTSIAPGNYLFPYAPGLYVFAATFAPFLPRSADMLLLRTVVSVVDVAVALLVYGAVARIRGDRLAGAFAVALYHLIPLDFQIVTVGNLTNAFAQSLSVAALAMMAAPTLRLENRGVALLFTLLLTWAFLSHTSTFALLAAATLSIAVAFRFRGGPALRSPALTLAIALGVALVIAVVSYYAHFLETYRTEFARIGAETAAGAPAPGGRTIGDRIVALPRDVSLYLGYPALALAAWGSVVLWRLGARDRLTLAVAGWTVACVAFLVLGVLTPIDMRYYLAAIPVVAVLAGIGASAAWSAGGAARIIAAALLAWALLVGVRQWWGTLS